MNALLVVTLLAVVLVGAVGVVLAVFERNQMRKDFGFPAAERLSRHLHQSAQGFEPTQM